MTPTEKLADELERTPFLDGYPVHVTLSGKDDLAQIVTALRASTDRAITVPSEGAIKNAIAESVWARGLTHGAVVVGLDEAAKAVLALLSPQDGTGAGRPASALPRCKNPEIDDYPPWLLDATKGALVALIDEGGINFSDARSVLSAIDKAITARSGAPGGSEPTIATPESECARLSALWVAETRESDRLRSPWWPVDEADWNFIMNMLGDGGRSRFWKEVLTQMREALQTSGK